MIRGRDNFLPVRSFTVGAENLAPFENGDVELVAVDKTPEIQMWFRIDFREGALHLRASSKMHEAKQVRSEFFAAGHACVSFMERFIKRLNVKFSDKISLQVIRPISAESFGKGSIVKSYFGALLKQFDSFGWSEV